MTIHMPGREHEPSDRHCAFWDGTRMSWMTRLVLGVRCTICSNVGTSLGATINPPQEVKS